MSHESRCESKRTGILYQKHIDSYTRTHAHACTRSRSHALTRVQTLACTHTYLVTFRQTDGTYSYIHTYIYNVHFRQTDKHTTDESRRQTDGIHTYIRTHVRTYIHKLCLFHYLSVCPSDCLSISTCVLSFCLPPSLRTCLSACLPFCLSIGRWIDG